MKVQGLDFTKLKYRDPIQKILKVQGSKYDFCLYNMSRGENAWRKKMKGAIGEVGKDANFNGRVDWTTG